MTTQAMLVPIDFWAHELNCEPLHRRQRQFLVLKAIVSVNQEECLVVRSQSINVPLVARAERMETDDVTTGIRFATRCGEPAVGCLPPMLEILTRPELPVADQAARTIHLGRGPNRMIC